MLWWPMRSVSVIALAAALAGCSAAGSLFGGGSGDSGAQQSEPRADGGTVDAQGLGVYLELMRRLVEGDAVAQADAFADAADAVELAPTTTNRLRHALALAMPGHPGSDAGAAERELTALLADNTLLPEERVLAQIHLAAVSRRLVLEASAEQLRAELAEAGRNAERIEATLEENRRLRQQLEEATAKLEAITSIEQSIREREQ